MTGRTSGRDQRAELSTPKATKAEWTQEDMEETENYLKGFYPLHGVARRDVDRDGGRFTVRLSEAERFWSQVDFGDGTGCWIWLGYRDRHGYGQFKVTVAPGEPRTVKAHRWAFEHQHQPIPDSIAVPEAARQLLDAHQGDGEASIPAGWTLDHLEGCLQPACVRWPDHLEPVSHGENLRRRHARRRRTQPTDQTEGSNR